ncbi:MAG TPA: hypothetical protein VGL93_10430 [Streptosporangiaceae bacterium]|jgi:hypothetical protein
MVTGLGPWRRHCPLCGAPVTWLSAEVARFDACDCVPGMTAFGEQFKAWISDLNAAIDALIMAESRRPPPPPPPLRELLPRLPASQLTPPPPEGG